MMKFSGLAALLLALASPSFADELAEVERRLKEILPELHVDELRQLGDTDLFEAVIGGQIIYLSRDANYLFEGKVISLETRTDITEQRRTELRKATLAKLDSNSMISFAPENADYTLTVFTDIDCGYCRILHGQIADYNAEGIAIRYMAYPRGGIDSESYDKLVDVWCAKDQMQAMTDAKAEKEIPEARCDNPVSSHFAIGNQLGVRGTPAMFLDSGRLLPGYVPPKRLRAILDELAASEQL